MTEEQQAAYVNAQAACAMIEAMGMQAANVLAQQTGAPLPYGQDNFQALIEHYSIHHNGVLTLFRR